MENYFFKATTMDGEILEGSVEAESKESVIELIQSQGRVPIRVELGLGSEVQKNVFKKSQPLFKRKNKHLLNFTSELSTLLKAGLSLDMALALLINVNSAPEFTEVLEDIKERINGGASFADALETRKDIFPQIYVSLIRAGEMGGALEKVTENLAEHLERNNELRDSLKTAMVYPIILILVAVIAIVILLTYVIPQFKELFEGMGSELPLSTVIVLQSGDFVHQYGWGVVLGIVMVVLFIKKQLKTNEGQYRWHKRALALPMAGDLIVKMEVTIFSRTLGTLLSNGIPMMKAMKIVKQTIQNRVMVQGMEKVIKALNEGESLSAPLKKIDCFPTFAVQMIRVGEESGELEQMLLHLADIYEKEVSKSMKQTLSLLEPVLILVLGAIIAGVIMSILVAIMGINQIVI
jgi:general secretion pathway protein F